MKIKDYKCKKCGHTDFTFSKKNEREAFNSIGIYCSYCGAWFKWASKDEKNLATLSGKLDEESGSFDNNRNSTLTTFEGLPAGTVLVSSDGEMTVTYSDYWSENGKKEFCLADDKCLWRGCQFDPADWKIKEGE